MIIDSHVHLGGWDGRKVVIADVPANLKKLLREMRSNHVDHSLILASYRRKCADEPDTETVLAAVGKERRVSVVGSVDVLNRRDLDLAEMDGLLSARKIIAIKIYLLPTPLPTKDPAIEAPRCDHIRPSAAHSCPNTWAFRSAQRS